MAEALLGPVADTERGRELLKEFPYSIREAVEVLKDCRQSRKAEKELKILSHQPCTGFEISVFGKCLRVLRREIIRNRLF